MKCYLSNILYRRLPTWYVRFLECCLRCIMYTEASCTTYIMSGRLPDIWYVWNATWHVLVQIAIWCKLFVKFYQLHFMFKTLLSLNEFVLNAIQCTSLYIYCVQNNTWHNPCQQCCLAYTVLCMECYLAYILSWMLSGINYVWNATAQMVCLACYLALTISRILPNIYYVYSSMPRIANWHTKFRRLPGISGPVPPCPPPPSSR